MIDEGDIGRLSALVERAVADAAATGVGPSLPKQATRRKVSRRKLLDDLARAEASYHEAKVRHDALHHSGRGLTFEQAQQRVESSQALLRRAKATFDRERAIAELLPAGIQNNALEEARLARDHAAAALDGFKLMAEALSAEGGALRAEAANALDEAAEALQKLAAKLAELAPAKADAVVAVVQAGRADPVTRIRSALADIAPALAELVATDFLLTNLLGQKFAYDAAKAPDLFNARTVVTRFVDAIPARFAPEQLDGFAIRDAAVKIATRLEKELTTDA